MMNKEQTSVQKNDCDTIMNRYLSLDKDERVPLSVTIHLLLCKKCRTQVRLLTIAERTISQPLKVQIPLSEDSICSIMKKISPDWDSSSYNVNPVSLKKWIVGGITMILFMLAFGFMTSTSSNEGLLIAFYLVFAGAVTAYCALFIASNLDFFIKRITMLKITI